MRSVAVFCFTLAIGAAALTLTPAGAKADIITLDLNSLALGAFSTPQSVDGFVLTPIAGQAPAIVNIGGVYALEDSNTYPYQGPNTLLTRADGSVFTLLSVQLAAVNGDRGGPGIRIFNQATGNGSIFGANCTSSGGKICAGVTLSSSFQTESFLNNANFQGVTGGIDFNPFDANGDGYAIAAITVSFVPEPASIWVLLAGLAGLAWLRQSKPARQV